MNCFLKLVWHIKLPDRLKYITHLSQYWDLIQRTLKNVLMDNGNILFCRQFPIRGHLCIYAPALLKHFIFTSKKIISGLSKHSTFSRSWNTCATVHSLESL